jgi:signal transduction histidine kinase
MRIGYEDFGVTLRPAIVNVCAGAIAAALTVATAASPYLSFAYRSPSLHVALEVAAGIFSGLAAYLVYGRFRESGCLGDLLLVAALAVFSFTNVFFSALPAALGAGMAFPTWAPLAGRSLGTVLFAAAPFVRVRLARPKDAAGALFAALAGMLLVIASIVAFSAGGLPAGIDPALSPDTPNRAFLEGNAVIHVLQLANAVLFAIAAVGFTRRATAQADELLTWLAVGATVSAFARVNYFLFPSLYSEWVYTGDLFRLGFYLLLLVGALREINRYWQRAASAAVLEERRRIARDLHDGLAQELAFISMQSKWLAADGDEALAQIATASDRAFDESRRAIAALTMPLDQPLATVLADVAEDVAGRVGLEVELDLTEEVDVSPATREALVRIVREAVTNAARHGHASVVRIELSNGPGIRLCVSDDGSGFDPERTFLTDSGGFGLTSMRERAHELGGTLNVKSSPGLGTEVEVALP